MAAKKKEARVLAQATSILDSVAAAQLKTDLPVFRPGDKVVVKVKVKEGDKFRTQAYEGIVLARHGTGIRETFTVRKVSAGIGVERVFPIHAPTIESIEVLVEGFVRRSKLYYLRDRSGRSARIQDRNLKLSEAKGHSESKGLKGAGAAKA